MQQCVLDYSSKMLLSYINNWVISLVICEVILQHNTEFSTSGGVTFTL